MSKRLKIYSPKKNEIMKSAGKSPYCLKLCFFKQKNNVFDLSLNTRKKRKSMGQGMTEYLIIVALVAVGSIAIVRTMGGSLRTAFAKITMGIQGKGNPSSIRDPKINKSQYKRNDMSDFANGAIE